MIKGLMIRSSSAEFLIFERQTHDKGIQVRFEDGDLWLTQKAIGELFDTTRNNITMHINDIYDSYELEQNSTSKKFLLVQAEIREIGLSERRFCQKVTDIYATSVDYDKKSPTTINFFKKVQNKMHFAVSHQTAAEIIYNRADSEKEYMGLTSWKNFRNRCRNC